MVDFYFVIVIYTTHEYIDWHQFVFDISFRNIRTNQGSMASIDHFDHNLCGNMVTAVDR